MRVLIPGQPVAQGRPRFARVGKKGGKQHVVAYDPEKSRGWKAMAAGWMLKARQAQGARVMTGPLRVEIVAMFACPVGDERKGVPAVKRRHWRKPDAENCAKACLDSASGILFEDDAQVCELSVSKWICAQGDSPRVEMTVTQLAEEQ